MNKILTISFTFIGVLFFNSNTGVAAEPSTEQSQVHQQSEVIYGSQLMTEQERNEFRIKMQSMKTQQEREAFRAEHHQQMQNRATAQGVTLPDEIPYNTRTQGGMGQGGMGQGGMGQGGMGQGGMGQGGMGQGGMGQGGMGQGGMGQGGMGGNRNR